MTTYDEAVAIADTRVFSRARDFLAVLHPAAGDYGVGELLIQYARDEIDAQEVIATIDIIASDLGLEA